MPDEVVVEKPGFALDWGSTQRGFGVARFADVNGNECSIQESSSIMPRLWLGVDKPARGHMRPDMGEAEYRAICAAVTRMHLSKSQALALGRAMVEWAEGERDLTVTRGD